MKSLGTWLDHGFIPKSIKMKCQKGIGSSVIYLRGEFMGAKAFFEYTSQSLGHIEGLNNLSRVLDIISGNNTDDKSEDGGSPTNSFSVTVRCLRP